MTTAPDTPTTDWLRLDQQICFSLNAASRAFGGVYRVILKDLGITYPQYLVMLLLWEESSVPVGRIGERLSLESSTLSPLLKRLESGGLVTRSRDGADERLVIVGLTAKGRRLQQQTSAVTLEVCRSSGLSMDQQTALMTALRELGSQVMEDTRRARAS
jgi:MarR family transcriptional regulator, organic hydroperoxide resistance regulator